MGELVHLGGRNRAARRAYVAQRRREDRQEAAHQNTCVVACEGNRCGVPNVRIPPDLHHAVHRVLGEPSCPLCPRCAELKRAGKIDPMPLRGRTLAAWRGLLRALGGKVVSA